VPDLPVAADCHGEEIRKVVDTWPSDGGWDVELVVVRLPRFGERRMLPAAEVRAPHVPPSRRSAPSSGLRSAPMP
jgi:hypothetical protein